jgi:hypothetical protein
MRYVFAFLLGVFVTIGVVAWLAEWDYRREVHCRVWAY